MRTCFIHIGTHRTGTTSFQAIMSRHAQELSRLDYLYPRSGRPAGAPMGHHNLAWEMAGDPRFRPESGCIEDLLTEISDVPQDVILSSEDFECAINHSDRFDGFVKELQAQGMTVKVILYLRNQIEYATSLYLAKFYFGFDQPFTDYLDGILAEGRFHWQNWTCSFSYDEFLRRLETIEGIEIIVRSFDEARKHSATASYLALFGLTPSDLNLRDDVHENRQQSMREALTMFFTAYVRRLPSEDESRILVAIGDAVAGKRVGVTPSFKLKIAQRFADSNEHVFNKYGVPRFEAMMSPFMEARPDDYAMMETLFSSSLPFLIETTAPLLRAT